MILCVRASGREAARRRDPRGCPRRGCCPGRRSLRAAAAGAGGGTASGFSRGPDWDIRPGEGLIRQERVAAWRGEEGQDCEVK